MGHLYVARSATLGKWASDVGLSKHIYKLGFTEEPIAGVIAAGWAGLTDWKPVKQQAADGLDEAAILDRVAGKVKSIDPTLYPRIKGTQGLFKIVPAQVENHIIVTHALAGNESDPELKLKPADFADYLIHLASR
ncbi:MAG TPA: hypothetical protein VNT30_02585 [Stellaceae bacterium]|nr:hypothetical protein [Stellaceae bacterium]